MGAGQAKVLAEPVYGGDQVGIFTRDVEKSHGTSVASKLVGKVLGAAKKAILVVPSFAFGGPSGPEGLDAAGQQDYLISRKLHERRVEIWIRAMDDILTPDDSGQDKRGRAVINFSDGEFLDLGFAIPQYENMVCKWKSAR